MTTKQTILLSHARKAAVWYPSPQIGHLNAVCGMFNIGEKPYRTTQAVPNPQKPERNNVQTQRVVEQRVFLTGE